jgi:hypothetical protein
MALSSQRNIGNLRLALARIVGDNEDRALNPMVRALMRELREPLRLCGAKDTAR